MAGRLLPTGRTSHACGCSPRQIIAIRPAHHRRPVQIACSSSGSSKPGADIRRLQAQQQALLRVMAFSPGPEESPDRKKKILPSQGDMIVEGIQQMQEDDSNVMTKEKDKDIDYLAELIAIQQNGPKAIGFFGTRNMGFLHQQLIEILSYAMVLTGNHIYTSGATGTNAAVIRGALRAECPERLTVVLPQSMSKQPAESQDLLSQVENVVSMPQNDGLSLLEASRICNKDIVARVQQVICFAFHDSTLMQETCQDARDTGRLVTLFYLD